MNNDRSIGVWLDSHEAFIVILEGDKVTEDHLESGVETRERIEGEGKDSMRMGDQFSVPEKKKRHRLEHEFKNYFDDLEKKIRNSAHLVLFGPGQVPSSFRNHLLNNSAWKNVRIDLEKADSMTDAQKSAWVKEYFNEPAARKPHPQG